MKTNNDPLQNFDPTVMTDITCPGCKEKLTPADIETFARCPYCDYQFKMDNQFEDFIFSPLLKRWAVNTTQQFIR